MVVDREGVHCILVSDYELFYNHWSDNNNKFHSINELIEEEKDGAGRNFLTGSRPSAIVSVDIHHDPGEHNLFELVLGT